MNETPEPNYEIRRKTVGTAYPRNGNLDNPTKHYRYEVWLDGKLIGSAKLRRQALDLIEIHKEIGE